MRSIGTTKPKGNLGLHVIRANAKPSLIQRLNAALKGAFAKWQ